MDKKIVNTLIDHIDKSGKNSDDIKLEIDGNDFLGQNVIVVLNLSYDISEKKASFSDCFIQSDDDEVFFAPSKKMIGTLNRYMVTENSYHVSPSSDLIEYFKNLTQ